MLMWRTLTILTLMVGGLFVAPVGAQAHVGHNHAVPAATVMERTEGVQVIDAARVTLQDMATINWTYASSVAALPLRGQKAPESCPGGCCHSGASCCTAWLTAPFEIRIPVLGRATPVVAAIGDPALRRMRYPSLPSPWSDLARNGSAPLTAFAVQERACSQ